MLLRTVRRLIPFLIFLGSLWFSSGVVQAKYRYDSFGNLLAKSGPLADVNLLRFSGKEYHPRSGLYYYGFRYYQPNLQRWLNQDPIGRHGGLNIHAFVGNDPVNYVDEHGLAMLSWICGQGWSGPKADAFEESIGESFLEQLAEMGAGLGVLASDGLGGSRELLVEEMSDRYADMYENYGETAMYIIAANDLTGGTPLLEGLSGIDLQAQVELNGQDRLQRGLMGGGQMALAGLGGASTISSARAGYTGTGLRLPNPINSQKSVKSPTPDCPPPNKGPRFEGLTDDQISAARQALAEAGLSDADILIKGADMPPGYAGMTLGDEGFVINRSLLNNHNELVKTLKHEYQHILDRRAIGDPGAYGKGLEDSARAAEGR